MWRAAPSKFSGPRHIVKRSSLRVADVRARIEELETDTMGKSWFDALQPEFQKPYFRKVRALISCGGRGPL
jgi:hypothetical protein